jgi:hypothetical protein
LLPYLLRWLISSSLEPNTAIGHSRLLADVGADDSCRPRRLADPQAVPAERGRAVPEGVE